jgi:hypothetical protein
VREHSDPSKHIVFLDNFFTSYDLLRDLRLGGFKATGTMRPNRSGGANKTMMSDKELMKTPRGSYDHRCDGQVFVAKWYDNAVVTLASNTHTQLPEQTASRRIGRKVERVCRPFLVAAYNEGMGGVDSMDRYLSQYRPGVRGKKWWWPLFTHAINLSVVAAWRFFLHLHPESQEPHLSFRRAITLCLLKKSETQGEQRATGHLPIDVRRDGVDHNHEPTTEGRCVVCHNNTKIKCSKCGVRLHYSRGKNCFQAYHTHLF